MNCNSSAPSSQTSRSSTCAISQQPTLVGVAASPGSEAFRSAIKKFRARLSGKDLTDFGNTTYEELCLEVLRIQRIQDSDKSMKNLSRIQSFLEAMHQFGQVIEVFLNVSDAVAFVWGPIKFLLLTASTFVDSFETILDAYERIGENIPLLLEYESLFHHNPHMIDALELVYIDILEFHQQAMRFFSGKVWTRIFRSMWKDFSTKFSGILNSLRRHKELIECRASLSQYRRYQEDMAEMSSKLDELINQKQSKKMKVVKEWLAVYSQPEQDHDSVRNTRAEYPSTGDWILEHKLVEDWKDADVPSTPLAWMTGIPGAGKTVLASAIIDACKQRSAFVTSYFYCHADDQGSNSAVAVLRGLVDQLLDQFPQLLPPCHTRQTSSGEPTLRSLPLAKKLFEDFAFTIPKLFIIVDGLDECEQMERKQILDFFVEVVGKCDTEEPGKLRVLFVSQDYADIRKALHSSSIARIVPKVISLSSSDNERDICSYVRIWVDRIANKYTPLNEELLEYLRNLTVARAKGMFLYAKLVMLNLFYQPTQEDLLEAISLGNFPDGLEQAYERILRRIKKTSHPQEWEKAKTLLGWMSCAKRPLTWREIQVALSLNMQNQSVDYDSRRLRRDLHDICGSLVLISGDRVSLVHSTAKYYITKCTEDIHEPSVECELAALCLQYLTFPCFEVEEPTDELALRQMTLEGHFAFQDYAVAKWFHHVNAFVSMGKELLKKGFEAHARLAEMSTALDDFLTQFGEESWEEGIVAECRKTCSIFEDHDFYDNIVALMSHIYTFQKKGFEARHKVSIEDLDKALERNRKLLEELPPKLSPGELTTFRQFYDDERRFKCPRITCMYFSVGFKDAKSRKRHVNIHDRPYQCEVPDCLGAEGFANSKDLEKHTRGFHPEISDLAETFKSVTTKREKATWACSICGKTFTRNFHRKNHEKSHRGERPEQCPECGKAFTRANDCKRHQKLHDRK